MRPSTVLRAISAVALAGFITACHTQSAPESAGSSVTRLPPASASSAAFASRTAPASPAAAAPSGLASATARPASARRATSTPAKTRSSAASPTGPQNLTALVEQLDTCIHQHGAPNFPDPFIDSAGKVAFPDSAPDLPPAAQAACQHIVDQLPNPGNAGPTPISSGDYQQWLRFAVCMRSHGLPAWPDPRSDGSFPLPASLRTASSSAIAPAFESCRSLDPNPDGKWTVSEGGS